MNTEKINTESTFDFFPYPSIGVFRNAIYNVTNTARFFGLDANGEPIFNAGVKLPVLTYIGTVKMHGTNAAIIVDRVNDVIRYQSRERIITPISDNFGFATFCSTKQKEICDMVSHIEGDVIAIYGEWCGSSIQKGVALSQLEKMFVIFDIRVINGVASGDKELFEKRWLTIDERKDIKSVENKIFNVLDYETFTIDIDYEDPKQSQNVLIEKTIGIEDMCPVGKSFGVEGVGEGTVLKCITPGYEDDKYWFKSKGEKHSVTKVKTLAAVDIEKVNSIKEFVDSVVTENRLEQGFAKLTEMGHEPTSKSTGVFLNWVKDDVIKEEIDTIVGNGLEAKDVAGQITVVARKWFFTKLDSLVF